ncbi:hypothetical protein [Mastigocoleus testarum]|uniref:Uncharacterized protein n=1 Tax=Mastigocoleus testarum BC008 TaxID=371196 RepID=A0A0V7ZC06_9CYAN|nr:hypothetical protein [Mastigocoleus testarum]KST62040.1 hypothetical protein BC008_08390 [Mastigocoleus testarum BC008]KST62626.1 hypothetical protein BC008_37970 [Mastigocoleus testarum BC008]
MSNLKTNTEITSINQELFADLNEKSAETISGGRFENGGGKYEVFKVYNQTGRYKIPYTVDGKRTKYPSTNSFWVTDRGGLIKFDYDAGKPGVQLKQYNLQNGRKYAFRLNTRTAYKYDIELYDIGAWT